MNISELFDALNISHFIDQYDDEDGILSTEIEVHYQQNYPLKAKIVNAKMSKGKIVIALSEGNEYGDKDSWNESNESDIVKNEAVELIKSKIIKVTGMPDYLVDDLVEMKDSEHISTLEQYGWSLDDMDCQIQFWEKCGISEELFDSVYGENN